MKADLVTGAVVGTYRIQQKLGEYPEFVSYSANPLNSEQEVVLKAMRQPPALIRLALPDFQGRTTKFTQLIHPQLCPVREIVRDEQSFYIVSEVNRGQSLEEAIRQRGRFTYPAALAIVDQLLDLLTYLHQQKITCCDLRPTNLYLDDRGNIQLADAGLIQLLSLENQTTAPETISALEYTAPERILYSKILGTKVDARADLYAVGVLFYELLTGRAPLTAENRDQMIRSQIEAAPLPLRSFVTDVPPPVEQIIFRALEKSPERRFAAAETMRTALQRAQAPTAELTPLEPSLAYMMEALQMSDAPTLQPEATAATSSLSQTGKLTPTGSLKTSHSGPLKPEQVPTLKPRTTGSLRNSAVAKIAAELVNTPTLEPTTASTMPSASTAPTVEDAITEPLPEIPFAEPVTLNEIFTAEETPPAPAVELDISANVVSVSFNHDDDRAFDELRSHVQPIRWKRTAAFVAYVLAGMLMVGCSVFWMSRSRTFAPSNEIASIAATNGVPNEIPAVSVNTESSNPSLAPGAAASPSPTAHVAATIAPTPTPEPPAPKVIATPEPPAPKVIATPKAAVVRATPVPRASAKPVAPFPAPQLAQVEAHPKTKTVKAARPNTISEKERRKRAILKSLSQ